MSEKLTLLRLSVYLIVISAAIVTVAPFILILFTSFKTKNDLITSNPLSFPKVFHWENYVRIWEVGNFTVYFKNSVIVTVAVVVGVMVVSILGAYAFAFLKFKGSGFLTTLILLGLMLPGELLIIPLFHNLKAIGILNSLWALILPQIGMNVPFAIFLLRGFMREIPKSLLESARMDGSTELQNLLYIILPLIRPALVTVLIFIALGAWNNFLLPTILIQTDTLRTLPVGINYFQSKFTADYPMIATAANISAIPTLLIYLIFQRKFISGMMMGALKE